MREIKTPLRRLVAVIVLALGFYSCDNNDGIKPAQARLVFSIESSKIPNGGRSMEDVHSILVSIKDQDGNFIFDRKKLVLFKFGAEYLSEPVGVTVEDFSLTEFIVLDDNDAAVYATPLEGSSLSYLVDDPLPMSIGVVKDETTKVTPEVIKVSGSTGADFGYITFSFDVVETFEFLLAVMVYDESSSNLALTSSITIVKSGGDIVFSGELPASTNEVAVEDELESYSVHVSKTGYLDYEKSFTLEELQVYSSTPLIVTLLPETLASDLIAYYPFSGNADDHSPSGFHGNVNGAFLTTDRNGTSDAAYGFDGVDDYISVPHHSDLNVEGNFTISLWARVASDQEPHNGINDILRKWIGNAEGYPFSISYTNAAAAVPQKDNILHGRYDGAICLNVTNSYSPEIENDTFIHIVMVRDGATLKQYLDNVLVDEVTDNMVCNTSNTADMTIGCRGNLVRFFKGTIDDLRIYNRALSSNEVASLYLE